MGVKIELEPGEIITIINALEERSKSHGKAIITNKFAGKKLSERTRHSFVIVKDKIDKLLKFFRSLEKK